MVFSVPHHLAASMQRDYQYMHSSSARISTHLAGKQGLGLVDEPALKEMDIHCSLTWNDGASRLNVTKVPYNKRK